MKKNPENCCKKGKIMYESRLTLYRVKFEFSCKNALLTLML